MLKVALIYLILKVNRRYIMKPKIFLVFSAIILLISAFLLFELHHSAEKEMIQSFGQHQLADTWHISNELEESLSEESRAIELITESISNNHKTENIAASVQNYFEYLKKDHVKSISVYDENGVIVYSTEKNALFSKHEDSDFFRQASLLENKGKQLISTDIPDIFAKSVKKTDFNIIIASPIITNQTGKFAGQFAGIVLAVADLSYVINQFSKDSIHDTNEYSWILDSDGTVLYHSEHPEMLNNNIYAQDNNCLECHESFNYVDTILLKPSGTISYKLNKRPEVLSSFSTLNFKNISWKIALNIPLEEVTESLHSNLIKTVILFIFILISFVGGFILISRGNRLRAKAMEEAQHWKTEHTLELQLREAEKQYKIIVENSPSAIFVQSEGKIVFANPAALSLYGVTDSKDILGKTILDFVHPIEREIVSRRVKEMLESGNSLPVNERRVLRHDNSIIIAEVAPTPTTFQNKPAILMIVTDITERKQTELERQVMKEIADGITSTSSIAEFLKLAHNSLKKRLYADNCFISLFDRDTKLFNFPYFIDYFEQVPPSSMENSCAEFVFRTGKPLLLTKESFRRLAAQNETELVGPQSAAWLGVPLQTSSTVTGVLVIQNYEDDNTYSERDVQFLETVGSQIAVGIERKQAKAALRASEAKWRALYSILPVGISILDKQNEIVDFNAALSSILGIESENLIQGRHKQRSYFRADGELMSAEELPSTRAVKENRVIKNVTIGVKKEDDEIVWTQVSAAPLNLDGISCVVSTIDISHLKRAEEKIIEINNELKQINIGKDKFFSIIAHDLRSPFAGLLGLSEIMAAESPKMPRADIIQISKSLYESVENVYKLIDNLLEWARLQKDSIKLIPDDINLSGLFLQNIDSIKLRASQKDISIINEIPETLHILADEKMISTVLRNLLANAVKFTRKGGKVVGNAIEREDGMIEISVTDTGIGIPSANIDKLFKLGEDVGARGTDNEPSTGLGLILCKEFVEKHSGKIWVESIENVGSTFYFTVPQGTYTQA